MGYSSSKTLATVGEGTLHVKDTENSDDMERLNRDTSKVNKDLYSGSVGTSVTATLDHRLLSEDGWKLIAQDFVKTGMLLDTINQVVSNQTVGLSEFGAELRKREITYETVKERIAQDKDLAAMLNSPAYTDEQKKAITNGITQQVMVELGYKPIENVLIATTEPGRDGYQIKGYFSLETGKAYINDFYNNSNADLLKTAGTETQRAIDAQEGSKFDQSKEYRDARSEYSQNFGSNIASYADFALYFTGQGSLSTANNSISTTAQTQNNNAEFKGLDKSKGDNLTIFLHGTYSSPKNADPAFIKAVGNTFNEDVVQFDWSGKGGTANGSGAENSSEARSTAAIRLAQFVEGYQFKEGEPLNIIAHSHGGNVIKDFTQFYEGTKTIDNVIFMGTPARDDYFIDYSKFGTNAKIINVYDTSDMVQRLGGSDVQKGNYVINFDRIGIADRAIDNPKVNNIEVESGSHPTKSHSDLDTKKVWEQIK